MLRAIGLMSGTSLDGVDAAWIETDGTRVARFGPALTRPYPQEFRAKLRSLIAQAPHLAADDPEVAKIAAELAFYHAEAVAELGASADVIGFHGQTILHVPKHRRTWQIGDAQALAHATGLRVVYDFRSADVAAGGQGAPLAPVFHAALAASLEKPLAVLNIGGVANVTFLGAHGEILACDTGPGNAPLDDWAMRHTGIPCDRDGVLARRGRVAWDICARLLSHPYFRRPPPKSVDREEFSSVIAESGLDLLSPEDGAATLVAFIAEAVSITPLPTPVRRWLVCGGGRHNPALMEALRARLKAPVEAVEAVGWDGDALEAQCFGFLAVRTLAGLPLSFPETTGVPQPCRGGRIALP